MKLAPCGRHAVLVASRLDVAALDRPREGVVGGAATVGPGSRLYRPDHVVGVGLADAAEGPASVAPDVPKTEGPTRPVGVTSPPFAPGNGTPHARSVTP